MDFSYIGHAQSGTELSQQFEHVKDLRYCTIGLLQNEILYWFIVMPVNKENELPLHAGYYTSITKYPRQSRDIVVFVYRNQVQSLIPQHFGLVTEEKDQGIAFPLMPVHYSYMALR